MIARILVVVCVLGVAARADGTFEAKAAGAIRIHRVENLVWALTAACDKGDDTQQRQCRHVRDARARELGGATLLVDGDADAFDIGAWSAQKKSVAITVSSCIRCAGVEVDGKTWYVLGSGASPVFVGDKPKVGLLHDSAKPFADEAAAKAWAKSVASARVELLVKLPARSGFGKFAVGGKTGLALEIIGFRVVQSCDGAIVAASPQSGPADADKQQCAKATATAASVDDSPKLDALTPAEIQAAMKPVVAAAQACFEKFGVVGKAKLKLTVLGDGSVAKYEQQGDFTETPTGKCIDAAAQKVAFPRAKQPRTSFSYPIVLR